MSTRDAEGTPMTDAAREDVKTRSQAVNKGQFSLNQVPHRDKLHLRQGSNVEELSAIVVDCAYKLHVEAGPGLLESVYETVLAKMLKDRGLQVRRQASVPIHLMGLEFDEGFRADLIVEESLVLELKSVENLAPVHAKQILTYLRLLKMPLGLLINFGAATFKEGVRRIVNNHKDFASSRLRVNTNLEENPQLTRSREDTKENKL